MHRERRAKNNCGTPADILAVSVGSWKEFDEEKTQACLHKYYLLFRNACRKTCAFAWRVLPSRTWHGYRRFWPCRGITKTKNVSAKTKTWTTNTTMYILTTLHESSLRGGWVDVKGNRSLDMEGFICHALHRHIRWKPKQVPRMYLTSRQGLLLSRMLLIAQT